MFAQTYNNTFISQNNNYDILINQLDKLGWPTLLSKKEQTKLTKPASNPKTIAGQALHVRAAERLALDPWLQTLPQALRGGHRNNLPPDLPKTVRLELTQFPLLRRPRMSRARGASSTKPV